MARQITKAAKGGAVAKKGLAAVILLAVTVFLVKVIFGLVVGFLTFVFWVGLFVVIALALIWALRNI